MTDRPSRSADRRPARAGGMTPDRGDASGGRRISPGVVFLVVAIVGSIAYMAYTVTVRDTSQIPLLASGAVVLAVVFGALAAYSLRAILRAGSDGRDGRALMLALVGGGAAMAAAGFAAGAIILFQIASGP
jgi:FtsH-binding integral membrane protein